MLYCIILYYISLCYIILYCTVPYYVVYIVLYYTILYYVVLHRMILYHTIPMSALATGWPCGGRPVSKVQKGLGAATFPDGESGGKRRPHRLDYTSTARFEILLLTVFFGEGAGPPDPPLARTGVRAGEVHFLEHLFFFDFVGILLGSTGFGRYPLVSVVKLDVECIQNCRGRFG